MISAQEVAQRNWRGIAIGATVTRKKFTWMVARHTRRDTSVELLLVSGRRRIQVNVPVCITGPVLWEVDLRPARPAPRQQEMRL